MTALIHVSLPTIENCNPSDSDVQIDRQSRLQDYGHRGAWFLIGQIEPYGEEAPTRPHPAQARKRGDH